MRASKRPVALPVRDMVVERLTANCPSYRAATQNAEAVAATAMLMSWRRLRLPSFRPERGIHRLLCQRTIQSSEDQHHQ
jgi:hypothetical protein